MHALTKDKIVFFFVTLFYDYPIKINIYIHTLIHINHNTKLIKYSYFSQNVLKPGGPQIHTAYLFIEFSFNVGKYLIIEFSSMCSSFLSSLSFSSSDKI